MAFSKLHICFLLSLFFTLSEADTIVEEEQVVVGSDNSNAFRIEFDKLTSKIHSLESVIEKKNHELKSKDESIAHKEKAIAEKEKTIKEKSDSITSLQSEVASLEAKGSLLDANEQLKKAHSQAHELENQVEKLQMEIKLKNNLREALETRTKDLKKKMLDLNSKLQDLQQVVDKQKTKLHQTERALKIAEEELKKAKFEATSKLKELTEVHGAWLPPWLAACLVGFQSCVESHWEEHGKPAFESLKQKALEKKAQAEKWAEPHMQTIKTVEKLQMEIKLKNNLREALETRTKDLKKKMLDLNPKLQVLQQKTKLHQTERALKIAEEELKKAKFEATSKLKELTESCVESHWEEHGKPAFESLKQKALEKKAQAEKWAELHMQTIKTVEKLQMEIKLKNNLREALETRTKDLKKKMLDLNPKLQDLQQKTKLHQTERALKIAEEELKKAKFEATSKLKELTESCVESHWEEHGKPAFESLKQKALEKKAQAEKWAEPHMQTIKTVEKLQMEIKLKNNLREALETRTKDLKKKMLELNPKLQDLQQKTKLHQTECALKIAEDELKKAKFEATSKLKELTEVHGAWLPPWLAACLVGFQSCVESHWEEHGKPAFESLKQKALEKKAQAEKWAEPHMQTIKTKWIPAAKEQWVMVTTNAEPQLQSLTKKTKEVYIQSKDTLTPHMIKIKKVVDTHFQIVKKVCSPYLDQIATAIKPHLDKARETVAPYTKEAVIAYRKFLESATKYHDQVQGVVEESLKKHEISRDLATKELVWFAASALLALPIFILFETSSAIFFKKAKRPIHNPNQPRRKAKRAHPDK